METTNPTPKIHLEQSIFFRALGTTHKVLSESVGASHAISRLADFFGLRKYFFLNYQQGFAGVFYNLISLLKINENEPGNN